MSTLSVTKELAVSMMSSLPIGILLVTRDGVIVYANTKAEDVFGFCDGEFDGLSIEDLMPERYREEHRASMDSYFSCPQSVAMSGGRTLTGLKKNREEFSLQIGLTPLVDNHTLVSFIESTNEVIKPSVSNDLLTGLPNRGSFDEYSEKLRKLAIRNNKSIILAFIDLDNFKSVNDDYGHHIGDLVLCDVANILKTNLRTSEVVARIGGDEFVACLYDLGKPSFLEKLLTKLQDKITAIKDIDGHTIDIGASIGALIAHSPKNIGVEQMIDIADTLMYEAKKAGKGKIVIQEIDGSKET